MPACICLQVWKATNTGPNITQHPSDITLYCARFTQGKPQSTLTIVTRDTCLGSRKFGDFFFQVCAHLPHSERTDDSGWVRAHESNPGERFGAFFAFPASGSLALAHMWWQLLLVTCKVASHCHRFLSVKTPSSFIQQSVKSLLKILQLSLCCCSWLSEVPVRRSWWSHVECAKEGAELG